MEMTVIIPIIMFLIYHAFNVYTDMKFRVTKNIWHALFLVIGLVYYYLFAFSGEWYKPLIAMLVALVIGIGLELMKLSSPGDTKMFIITSLQLSMMAPHQWYVRVALAVIIFHMFLLALFTYGVLFKQLGVRKTFKNQWNDIRALVTPGVPITRVKVFDHFPGAVTIMTGSLAYFVIVTILERTFS